MPTLPTNAPRGPQLGPGREFDLIRSMCADHPLSREVRVGPGDDAAVLEGGWVVCTDMAVEDVHFRRSWMSDEEVGHRAALAAISDIAAMAATPVALLLSVAAPVEGVDLAALSRGVQSAASKSRACVVGGDVSRSTGSLVIDVVAMGRVESPVQRTGAEPGDEIWVTGALGGAAAAVRAWEGGSEPRPEFRSAFVAPALRVDVALALVEHEIVDAMIDLSDGLAGDIGHIAAASGVAAHLEADRVPVAPHIVDDHGASEALDLALFGGEDYELCFVSDPGVVDVDYFASRFGVRLTRVGTVAHGEGVWLHEGGEEPRRLRGGFDHWGGSKP